MTARDSPTTLLEDDDARQILSLLKWNLYFSVFTDMCWGPERPSSAFRARRKTFVSLGGRWHDA